MEGGAGDSSNYLIFKEVRKNITARASPIYGVPVARFHQGGAFRPGVSAWLRALCIAP